VQDVFWWGQERKLSKDAGLPQSQKRNWRGGGENTGRSRKSIANAKGRRIPGRENCRRHWERGEDKTPRMILMESEKRGLIGLRYEWKSRRNFKPMTWLHLGFLGGGGGFWVWLGGGGLGVGLGVWLYGWGGGL